MTFFSRSHYYFATAQPGDSYTLQWKLKEGDTFFAKRETRLESSISINREALERRERGDGRASLPSEIGRGASHCRRDDVPDDRKEDREGRVDFPKAKTFTGTLDDKMKVTKFEGYDKFLDAITDGDEARKVVRTMTAPDVPT